MNKDKSKIIKIIISGAYDIIVATAILLFVYWVTQVGIEENNFHVPFVCMCILIALISIKNAIVNPELKFIKFLETIYSDMIKPLISMVLTLILFIVCLGEEKRSALNCALDVGNMIVLCVFVVPAGLLIYLGSKFLVFIYNKIRSRKQL